MTASFMVLSFPRAPPGTGLPADTPRVMAQAARPIIWIWPQGIPKGVDGPGLPRLAPVLRYVFPAWVVPLSCWQETAHFDAASRTRTWLGVRTRAMAILARAPIIVRISAPARCIRSRQTAERHSRAPLHTGAPNRSPLLSSA